MFMINIHFLLILNQLKPEISVEFENALCSNYNKSGKNGRKKE